MMSQKALIENVGRLGWTGVHPGTKFHSRTWAEVVGEYLEGRKEVQIGQLLKGEPLHLTAWDRSDYALVNRILKRKGFESVGGGRWRRS